MNKSTMNYRKQGWRRDVSRRVQTTNKIRIATINVGTLTGKSEELARMLRKRRIDICTLQETRWSGAKSYDMERERGANGYKLVYFGKPHTRYGVGIAISERFRDAIKDVDRCDDRLMKISLVTVDRTLHVFTTYAPQTGRPDSEKGEFWRMLDAKIRDVPADDYVIIAGDLNGHVGEKADGSRCHGGKGYGTRNDDGDRIIDFADAHDLVVCNTWFIKRKTQLLSYYSGNTRTQVDYILVRRQHFKTVTNAKTVPYETIAPQHRPLIAELRIKPPQQKREERTGTARIKWWRFHERDDMTPRIRLPTITTVEETWNRIKKIIHGTAKSILGTTKPGRRFINRDTWLWTKDVKVIVHEKKHRYHIFLADKSTANWSAYLEAKRNAKKAVAAARAAHYKVLYEKLDARGGERDLYRLMRGRHQQTQDVEKFHCVNGRDGKFITDRRAATERWREYFEAICTEEFPHPPLPQSPSTYEAVHPITAAEVSEAIRKMKIGKATGPDDIAAEIWKAENWNPAPWLADLFNRVIDEGRTPSDWQSSITVPIFKKKGNPADCSNYRPIRLLSHTMKIFERVIDKRIRSIVDISVNQAGFVKGCGTTDAIHAARLLVEKHREKKRPIHIAFLDLEKAFDRVPHELIWIALRQHNVPEELVKMVQLLYHNPTSQVRSAAGTSKSFRISVGVHQGSALSPLLFVLVINAITLDIQRPAPFCLLYADDVLLASHDKADLERLVQLWNDRLAQNGLRLNLKKTEYLTTDADTNGTITINNIDLPRTDKFKYLGSTLSADGELRHEVTSRINAAWLKWRSTTGVLCDRKIKDRLKSKIYRSVIRPVALYGSECWPATKDVERRLSVMETKMLRWISGITLFDHVKNEDIRGRYGTAPICDKMRESRLRWYGHALRANDNTLAKIGLNFDIDGKRPKGRPRQRWFDTLHSDLTAVRLHPDQAFDREKWKTRSRHADPAAEQDKG